MEALRICRGEGHGVPRNLRKSNIAPPAKTKRVPCIKNGGSDSRPILIAKYVDPQMTHTAAKLTITVRLNGGADGEDIVSSIADTLLNMTTDAVGTPGSFPPLCVLGDFAWDVLIRTNTELLRGGDTFGEVVLTPGGSAANVAVWASRCGMITRFVGKIGRDRFGQLAQEDLLREKVVAHLVETEAHSTGSVAVFVDHTGQRSMVSGHGADFYLLSSELPVEAISSARHLHLTAWSFFTDPPRSAARAAAKIARSHGATISFDTGSFQMIQEMGVKNFLSYSTDLNFDIVLPNKEEGQVLTSCTEPLDIAKALKEIFPSALIVLKLDAEGSLIYDNGQATHIPPATNNLVDATGAGDSYAGAFLAHYLVNHSAVDAARYATTISAWVIEHIGARPTPDARLRKSLIRS